MEKSAPGVPGTERQAVLDASLDAIFILDPDRRILNANLAAAQCYGYTIEELRQLDAAELAAPELRDVVSSRFAGMIAIYRPMEGDRGAWAFVQNCGAFA